MKCIQPKPFVAEISTSEAEVTFGIFECYLSPGVVEISAELIQAGGDTLHSDVHKLITLIWNKERNSHQWKESIVVLIHKSNDKTNCSNYNYILLYASIIIEAYHCCQIHTTFSRGDEVEGQRRIRFLYL
jgi:hypothetical protein